jgi:hypothetical protein
VAFDVMGEGLVATSLAMHFLLRMENGSYVISKRNRSPNIRPRWREKLERLVVSRAAGRYPLLAKPLLLP